MRAPVSIDLLPSPAHLEERLVAALADDTSAIAPLSFALEAIVELLHSSLLPTLAVAPAALERWLIARALTSEHIAREDDATAHVGTVEAFAHALDALRRHGLSAEDLAIAASALPVEDTGARARLAHLAAVAGQTEGVLAAHALCAAASVEGRLARALESLPPDTELPAPLGPGPRALRVVSAQGLDPARVAWLAALGRALHLRGGTLEIRVTSEVRRERCPVALDRALRDLEAVEDVPIELSFALRDAGLSAPAPALAALLDALAIGGRAPDAPVTLAEAHGPDEEARWLAAQVEQWLAQGLAPDEIAVVVRDPRPECVAPLARALDDARVPFRDEYATALLDSGLARAIVALPDLVARGAPREELAASLATIAGHGGGAGAAITHRAAHVLRLVHVASLFDRDLDARLAAAPRQHVTPNDVQEVLALRDGLLGLAQESTVAEHAARLARVVAWLGGRERYVAESHAVMASASYDPGARTILRALARDEGALRAVLALLGEIAGLTSRVPVLDVAIDGAAFAARLRQAAQTRMLAPPASGATGVRLTTARTMVGRSVRALAVAGLHDGGFPARPTDESLLGEAERRAILRSSGRLLERSAGREEETMLFLSVLACATDAVAISYARHDAGGRRIAPSPFVVDLRRALGTSPVRVHRDPLARDPALPPRGPERALRAYVQRPDAAPAALWPQVASARTRTAIETERREFFAGRRPSPGRYSGRVDHDVAVVRALDLAGYASAERPVDVTTLERAARCAFRAFAQEVLKLEARVEPAVTLDAKERGHLLHALVEAGQLALKASRGQPPVAQHASIGRALDRAGAEFCARQPRVDADLLRADLLAIRRQVETWLLRRMDAQDRWEMLATEVAFGPRREWPALEVPVDGEAPIVIRGRIDGVERMDDEIRVVEFKSGRGDGFRKRLREGVLETQFQLVIYTAALERASRAGAVPRHGPVDGVYVGFRDQSEHGLREVLTAPRRGRDASRLDVDQVVRDGASGEGALGDAVRRAILPMRRGVFAPRPRDCDFCDAASLCRVERAETAADE